MIEDLLNTNAKLIKKKPGIFRGNCPNHTRHDNNNLMVFQNETGGLNVHCHAHCTEHEILDGLGLDRSCLFPERTQQETDNWRELQAAKRITESDDKLAMSLWNELTILKQCLEGRIFGDDKKPANKTECWDAEKRALRLLPKLLSNYYG